MTTRRHHRHGDLYREVPVTQTRRRSRLVALPDGSHILDPHGDANEVSRLLRYAHLGDYSDLHHPRPSVPDGRMEVVRSDIQTRPYDRPQPPQCEPENMASNQSVDSSSITNTSSSSKQADLVTHDVSPTSTHSSPLISARKPSGWPIELFIRIDLGGSFHTYPCLGGPFRSLEEAEDAIKSHLDGLRSPLMRKDKISPEEFAVRYRLYWPDGTRKMSSKCNYESSNRKLLVQALLDKYNEDHHLLGDLAYELDDVLSFRQIFEEEGCLVNMFYHINLAVKIKGDDGFHNNIFFAEVTRIKGENEEYVLNCFCMVKPIDNGRCSGCTRYGQYDLKHPADADKYKGGHSTPFIQCCGVDCIPSMVLDRPGYIQNEKDCSEAEKAMLAAEEEAMLEEEEARIRYIYKCPGDSPIQAKSDGEKMPAGLAKRGEGAGLAKSGGGAKLDGAKMTARLAKRRECAGLAKRGEGAGLSKSGEGAKLGGAKMTAGLAKRRECAGLAKRGEGAGLAKREDNQGSVKYIVPARRGLMI
ncbi:hypothetical protein VPH35_110481 [Triticum aestivum]|uniref:uncharacterized protein n=1 Tax=Triticum aestivum TaxID=4565 RepID=UPI0008440704|nr:uncharacterized protein LOC123136787 [Triticum aestivum]